MSKSFITRTMPDGTKTYEEIVVNTKRCAWEFDEVCCNDRSIYCADFCPFDDSSQPMMCPVSEAEIQA